MTAAESPERVEEGRLHRVLRLLARAELVEAVRIDAPLMTLVQTAGCKCLGRNGHRQSVVT